MALTPAQQQTLKAYIEADATLNAFPLNSDGAFEIAKLLNLDASPDYLFHPLAASRLAKVLPNAKLSFDTEIN